MARVSISHDGLVMIEGQIEERHAATPNVFDTYDRMLGDHGNGWRRLLDWTTDFYTAQQSGSAVAAPCRGGQIPAAGHVLH